MPKNRTRTLESYIDYWYDKFTVIWSITQPTAGLGSRDLCNITKPIARLLDGSWLPHRFGTLWAGLHDLMLWSESNEGESARMHTIRIESRSPGPKPDELPIRPSLPPYDHNSCYFTLYSYANSIFYMAPTVLPISSALYTDNLVIPISEYSIVKTAKHPAKLNP